MNIFLVSLAVAMEPLAIAHALADECVFEEALEFLSKAPVQDQATEENIIFKAQLLAHTGHASEAILLLKKKGCFARQIVRSEAFGRAFRSTCDQ
jgi:hypothetical protein